MLALSTAWNAARRAGYAPALRELAAAGARAVALDGAAVHADAAEARRAARELRVEIAALFAPAHRRDAASTLDPGGLLSLREDARAAAVAAAFAAGRAAAEAGTAVVVVRAGEIPVVDAGREDRWNDRLGREGRTEPLAAEVRAAAGEIRRERPRFLESLCRSVWELARAAPELTWCVESPSSVAGLPFPDEGEALVSELRGRRVALWHDTAHAARLDALGAVPAAEWLGRNGARTAGVTLSDWAPPLLGAGGRVPPGAGLVAWDTVRGQLGASMLRVLRCAETDPPPLVADAVRELARLGCG